MSAAIYRREFIHDDRRFLLPIVRRYNRVLPERHIVVGTHVFGRGPNFWGCVRVDNWVAAPVLGTFGASASLRRFCLAERVRPDVDGGHQLGRR